MISIWFIFVALCSSISYAASSFEIVGHSEISKPELSQTELRDIYLGKNLYWEKSVRILPAYLDFNFSATQDFLFEVVGFAQNQFIDYWRRKLFSGRGIPPKRLSNLSEILQYVNNHEGAIAVIPSGTKLIGDNLQFIRLVK